MYTPLVEGVQTPDELRRLLRMMVGELELLTLRCQRPQRVVDAALSQVSLASFDRDTYESSGKLKITEVIPQSPAELAKNQSRRGAARRRWRRHQTSRQSG